MGARSNAIKDPVHSPMSVVRHSHYKWSHLGTRVCLCRHQSCTVVATSSKHLLQMYSTREAREVERLYYPPPLRLFSLDLYYVKKLFIRQGQTLCTLQNIYRPSVCSMKRENGFQTRSTRYTFDQFFMPR